MPGRTIEPNNRFMLDEIVFFFFLADKNPKIGGKWQLNFI